MPLIGPDCGASYVTAERSFGPVGEPVELSRSGVRRGMKRPALDRGPGCSTAAGVPSGASPCDSAIHSARLTQAPEGHGAVASEGGAVDADIAEHSVVQAREQVTVAVALIPGSELFDESGQRAAENPVKAHDARRARRFRRVTQLGALRSCRASAQTI